MSSATQSTTKAPSTEASTLTTTAITSEPTTSSKKKFGKNLNKLTAPPSAPPAVPGSGRKTNSSSKNGLLLLSTKRLSSGCNTGAASGTGIGAGSGGGGILSSKSFQNVPSKPLPNLALHTEYNPSTHDALMGVVVGASRLESQQNPDAWGVAEKQHAASAETFELGLSPLVGEEQDSHPKEPNKPVESFSSVSNDKDQAHNQAEHEGHNIDETPAKFQTSSWDEYGGRGISNSGGPDMNEGQGVYMAKLARERAEKRREEEDLRILEQKERAAQRLRELEEKMALKKITETGDPHNGKQTLQLTTIGLEVLGRSNTTSGGDERKEGVSSTAQVTQQRTLYDPNAPSKSYSSLLGGIQDVPPIAKVIAKEAATSKQLLLSTPEKNGVASQDSSYASANPQGLDGQPVIQLASYDDRDRGDRGTSIGPRMLFDPKSGSMVAVPSREESTACGRLRKERGKKLKPAREKDAKNELKADSTPDSKGLKKGKIRKDDEITQVRGRGGLEASAVGKAETRKGKIILPRKFPRTCGVLFSRDRKGNLSCADGCDGDLGYGVHSVPGGRMKNAEAYATYIQDQKLMKEDIVAVYVDPLHNGAFEGTSVKQDHSMPLQTGFQIAEMKEPRHDWIKPNEKIELITGVDESPTLQATAREWAPTNSNFAVPDRDKPAHSSAGSIQLNDKHNESQDDETDAEDAPVSMILYDTSCFSE
jgi:hypothetical protein